MWLIEQWHKFVYWSGQNSGSILALSGIIQTISTVVLVGVTGWYVSLTKLLADASTSQLKVLVQPDLGGHFRILFRSEDSTFYLCFHIANECNYAIRVHSVKIEGCGQSTQVALYDNAVISPGNGVGISSTHNHPVKIPLPFDE